jgi:hypothetical protein
MTLSITAICHYAEGHYAECPALFIVMLNVIMLSVIMLNFVRLSVVMTLRRLGRFISTGKKCLKPYSHWRQLATVAMLTLTPWVERYKRFF